VSNTVTLKSNIDTIINNLRNRDKRAIEAAEQGMVVGMRLFESQMIREQMSGRKRADFGLKRQTGNLARSWFINAAHSAKTFIVSWATRTKYAIYHQKPPGDENIAPNIPKRLHLLEAFKKKGLQIVSREVSRRLFKEYS